MDDFKINRHYLKKNIDITKNNYRINMNMRNNEIIASQPIVI